MISGSMQQVTSASDRANINPAAESLTVLQDMLSGGEILPSQLASPSNWRPELMLAAAVLAQAMADIRLRRRDGRDHIQVASALRWIRSNDDTWPLSFRRVCELVESKGVRVEVVAFAASTAMELRSVADSYTDLGQILNLVGY